jgi:hypothetical protein
MILPYSHKFNSKLPIIGDQPTDFLNKIWRGLIVNDLANYDQYDYLMQGANQKFKDHEEKIFFNDNIKKSNTIKIHTMRKDITDFWQTNKSINSFYFTSRPHMTKIHPTLPVVNIQKIKIVHDLEHVTVIIFSGTEISMMKKIIKVGKNFLMPDHDDSILKMAQNDGFLNLKQFFTFFNKDWEGKIIHWTNKMY